MLDGTKRRFTRDSLPLCGGGSFYFGPGWMSYSGGLDHSMPKERFQLVGLEPCGTA